MPNVRLSVILLLALVPLLAAAPSSPPVYLPTTDFRNEYKLHQNYPGPRTAERLAQLQQSLEAPDTRIAALRELIDFAGPLAYQAVSAKLSYSDGSAEIRGEAARSADAAADEPTIDFALDGSDPILLFWAIWHSRSPTTPAVTIAKLQRLVEGADESVRSRAVGALRSFPPARPFLNARIPLEKSPYVLDELMFAGDAAGSLPFAARLRELLADPDPTIRLAIINYIGANQDSAASRQFFLEAQTMDALLARAQRDPSANAAHTALALFTAYSNHASFPTTATAAHWWNENRQNWELARFSRSINPNGGPLRAAIITTGSPGTANPWHSTVILENQSQAHVILDAGKISTNSWFLFDSIGTIVHLDRPSDKPPPHWITLHPGQSVEQPILWNLESLKPGRYFLRPEISIDSDRTGAPASVTSETPTFSGSIPLPAILIEVTR